MNMQVNLTQPKVAHSPLMLSARALANRFICAITWETNVGVKREDEALVTQLLAAVRKSESDKRELHAALEGTLRHCVTVGGFPDKGKGRTQEQQEAYDMARIALSKGQVS